MPGATALGDILSRTLDNLDLASKAQKYAVFSIWHKVVGDVSRYARPRRIQGDVLFVATASSVWSQELTFMGESILAKLNAALGGQYLREIRFSEHLWSSQEPGSVTQRPGGLKQGGGGEEPERAVAAGDSIGDPSLERAFRRVATTMARRRQRLLASGYKLCRVCGCIYPAEKKECPVCRMEGESRAYVRAIAMLDRQPEISGSELMRASGLSDPSLAERARREAESRLVSAIRYHLASAVRDGAPASRPGPAARAELVPAIMKLAALRSQQSAETMSVEDLKKAVGRRMAGIVKKE